MSRTGGRTLASRSAEKPLRILRHGHDIHSENSSSHAADYRNTLFIKIIIDIPDELVVCFMAAGQATPVAGQDCLSVYLHPAPAGQVMRTAVMEIMAAVRVRGPSVTVTRTATLTATAGSTRTSVVVVIAVVTATGVASRTLVTASPRRLMVRSLNRLSGERLNHGRAIDSVCQKSKRGSPCELPLPL